MGPGGREMLEYSPWWGCKMMQHWNGGTHLWLCWRSEYAGVTEKYRLRAPSMSCMFFSDVYRYGEAFVFEGALLRSWYQAGSVQVKFKLEWTTGVEPSFGLADRACCTKSRDAAMLATRNSSLAVATRVHILKKTLFPAMNSLQKFTVYFTMLGSPCYGKFSFEWLIWDSSFYRWSALILWVN